MGKGKISGLRKYFFIDLVDETLLTSSHKCLCETGQWEKGTLFLKIARWEYFHPLSALLQMAIHGETLKKKRKCKENYAII